MVALPLLLSSFLLMAFSPSTYTPNNALPSRVYFTQSLGNVVGYEYDISRDYAIDHDEVFDFYLGYAYVPFYVDISYTESGYSLDYIQFVTINNPSYSTLVSNVPYFIDINSAGADWYADEYGFSVQQNFFANASGGELLFVRPYTGHATNFFGSSGTLGYQVFYDSALNTTLGGYVSVNGDVFIKYFEKFAWSYISSLSKTYATALSNSYSNGYDEGRSVGYNEGLNDGSDTTPGNVFSDLVSSILNVPLSILGGLSVFAIFDTPIISVIVSFLLLAIVLLIIKRFL